MAKSCRTLYGECIFSAHTSADLQLADELLQATASSLFLNNTKSLVAGFNSTILPYETAYFAAMSQGLPQILQHHILLCLGLRLGLLLQGSPRNTMILSLSLSCDEI
jgi:hypothetical protein